MDTAVAILRELWRYRATVAAFALLALLIALLVGFRATLPPESRSHTVGRATARILVDTPASQVIEVAPTGSEALGPRAGLLASLMVEGEIKAGIARRAGLRPEQLVAVAPVSAGSDPIGGSVPDDPHASVLTLHVATNDAGAQLPIIDVETRAPDTVRAAALANAAVTGLASYLDSQAAAERVPDARRLQLRRLGRAQAVELTLGPGMPIALAVGVLIFSAECALLLLVVGLARGWRTAVAGERGYEPRTEDDLIRVAPALKEPAA
jgi:hypothetical protein